MDSTDVAVILLAGGASARFGAENKLLAPLNGQPLICHSASALAAIPFAIRIVVVSPAVPLDWTALGFEQANAPENPMLSASIATGIERLRATACKACLIALADMPFVPRSHFEALTGYATVPVVATGSGERPMAPARFLRNRWDALASLSGDMGARPLLQDAPRIEARPEWLIDIDTPGDLAKAIRPEGGPDICPA